MRNQLLVVHTSDTCGSSAVRRKPAPACMARREGGCRCLSTVQAHTSWSCAGPAPRSRGQCGHPGQQEPSEPRALGLPNAKGVTWSMFVVDAAKI